MSPTEISPRASPAKRTPRKVAPRGKWSEQQLLTSNKSILIDADLTKLLANTAAWNCLEEDEKREILALLPADTHPFTVAPPDDPNEKIPPLPEEFLRYSNNWRDGIRQFQLDLQNGRYDPDWLRQAEEARRQRANGEFDAFKELEFEEFWGQKQKLDKRLLSGECGRIPLGALVGAGVILPGDVWRFNYVYGKGAARIVIDKEAQVHEINDTKLSFVIPAGQRVFLSTIPLTAKDLQVTPMRQSSVQKEETAERPQESDKDPETDKEIIDTTSQGVTTSMEVGTNGEHEDMSALQIVTVSEKSTPYSIPDNLKRSTSPPVLEAPAKRKRGRPREAKLSEQEIDLAQDTLENSSMKDDQNRTETKVSPPGVTDCQPDTEIETLATEHNNLDMTQCPQDIEHSQQQDPEIADRPIVPSSPSTIPGILNDIVVPHISSPRQLVTRILEIDGRMSGARTANAWKEFRCYRKNQDMGSLWDVRQAWYFKQK